MKKFLLFNNFRWGGGYINPLIPLDTPPALSDPLKIEGDCFMVTLTTQPFSRRDLTFSEIIFNTI